MHPLAVVVAALHLSVAVPPEKPAPAAQDAALDSGDASALPPEQRPRYALFRQKCSKCHALAIAMTAQLSPDEWRRHMKHMSLRPSSAITSEQAQAILEYLKFDAARRAAK